MNFILFILLSLPFHPALGWIKVDPTDPTSWKLSHMFLATMAQLQMIAVVINLLPVPPLDGFQIAGAFMPEETRDRLMSYSLMSFFVLFLIVTRVPGLFRWIFETTDRIYIAMGFDLPTLYFFSRAYNDTLGFKSPI
jgi:Zn-dependent protease